MSKRRDDLETNDIACLWLEITPEKGKSFLVGNLYRNPSEKIEWNERFEQFLEHVVVEDKEVILLGDFNKNLLNMNANRDWAVLTESLGFSQIVMQPTRVTLSTSSLLDHIYTNREDNIVSVRVPKLGISDHYAVFCNRKINQSFKTQAHNTITYRSFKHFNENEFLRDLFLVKWDSLAALENVDVILDKWYSLFLDVIKKHAPLKTHRVKNIIQPDWITAEILDTMKERDNHKRQGNVEDYKRLRNKVSELIKSAKKTTYENKIEIGKDDPKSIWKIFKEFGASNKSKTNNNEILGININGKNESDDALLAECFNDYFINIASNLKKPLQPCDFTKLKNYINSKVPENIVFDLPNIDQNFVYNFLSSLDTSKATGLDGIGPRLLKISSGVISRSIAFIAQKCIDTCQIPTLWKQAKVTPLHKGGAKNELNNYRPISILPTLSKLLEKFIQTHLMSYLNFFSIIHPTQSGFRPGHSTESALILMTEKWLKAINEGKMVGAVMVDFRKAFDLVDHKLLLEKIKCFKCSDKFVSLMKSYLSSRSQVVSVNSKKSENGFVKCGVPQGSILGPLLFLIFINDLPLYLSNRVYSTDLYADDTTIYDIQSDLHELKSNLQNSLLELHTWCQQNGMVLNTEKTKIMLITTRQKRLYVNENNLKLSYNNIDLQVTSGDKILGVYIDKNLQWNNHYQAVCKKVSTNLWLLSKICNFLSRDHRLMYYKAYIQPHLNYCNIIWGNSSNNNVSRITRLQKRACRLILQDEYTDFDNAKSTLKMLAFEESVFLNKAKMMFKVVNRLIPEYVYRLFERRPVDSLNMSLRSISNCNKMFNIPKPHLSKFKESMSYSGPIIWNAIPNEIKTTAALSSFSDKLVKWMTQA